MTHRPSLARQRQDHLRRATTSQEMADAYVRLADAIATDPLYAAIRDVEQPRAEASAREFRIDAEYNATRAATISKNLGLPRSFRPAARCGECGAESAPDRPDRPQTLLHKPGCTVR